ncbi:MAG TPA: aquaporin family protein [Hyphomonadaceae bacterium]|nr:aquaporin family protein [Hyphomonadaceae bacterium]
MQDVSATARAVTAEALGTVLLLAIVVGSGIMGERLAGGNVAIALLANAAATAGGLIVLIWMFGPLSGAHFNPVVSLVMALRGALSWRMAAIYVIAQGIGAVLGVMLAHAMFGQDLLQQGAPLRDGAHLWLAEAIATFGLIGVILSLSKTRPQETGVAVGLYILAAYWFTASTSFANPAVTLARSFTASFAGIASSSVPGFIGAQALGALAALGLFGWLFPKEAP